MPKSISVILPCHNAEATLGEALDSLTDQTGAGFEIIAVNDGSADATGEVLNAYAKGDSRVHVIHAEHGGIVAALRRGVEASSGDLLCRMDADDISMPDRLEKQRSYLVGNPEIAMCGTGVEQFGAGMGTGRSRYEEWINGVVTPEDIAREMFIECPLAHPTWMIRREVYEAVGGYRDSDWPEDYELLLRVYAEGLGIGKVPEPLVRWRHSEGRLSMSDPRYAPARFREVKHHYLLKTYLRDERSFYQWGAGEVGKPWLRLWGARKPEAVVDLHPRKIGKDIHGVEVIAPEELPGPGNGLVLVAVGAPGAREEIRAWFHERNYVETEDFLFLA